MSGIEVSGTLAKARFAVQNFYLLCAWSGEKLWHLAKHFIEMLCQIEVAFGKGAVSTLYNLPCFIKVKYQAFF